jgi:hypothetical protein
MNHAFFNSIPSILEYSSSMRHVTFSFLTESLELQLVRMPAVELDERDSSWQVQSWPLEEAKHRFLASDSKA